MTRFLTTAVLGWAAAATLTCAAPAMAQVSDASPGVTVTYGDLNIGVRAEAEALLKRIEAAANAVCGGEPNIAELARMANFKACRSEAVARAVDAVGSPTLTALAHGAAPDSFAGRPAGAGT